MRSRRRRTVMNARISCVLIWLFAFLLSVPTALTRDVHNITNSNTTVCGILHPEARWLKQLLLAISLMKSLLGFLVPFLIIITCYCWIGRSLMGAQRIKKSTRNRDDEVLRMLAAAVMAFFLCWMPHQAFHFMEMLTQLRVLENCAILDVIDTAMPFTICIAYFNSCVNPILYGFVGHNFRKNLLRLLHCTPRVTAGSHRSINSKMSTLSYRASEAVNLTDKKKASTNMK